VELVHDRIELEFLVVVFIIAEKARARGEQMRIPCHIPILSYTRIVTQI
jgi:hypothetical protein